MVFIQLTFLQDLRTKWGTSRFFLGKNKVMQRALGLAEDSAYSENSHKISAYLKGPDRGLFFTNEDFDEVKSFFESFSVLVCWGVRFGSIRFLTNQNIQDYARSGFKASETVTIPAGKLTQFSHSLEPHLRSLGMPVSLKNGLLLLLCEKWFVVVVYIFSPRK